MRLGVRDQLAVDFDVIAAGFRFGSELGDDATVDRHASGSNHLLGFASRCETGVRDDLLQSLRHHSV